MTEKKEPQNIRDIYDNEEYLRDNSNWHQEDSPYKASFVDKIIKRNNLNFDSCIDIGCGAGVVTELLATKFPESKFIGCDLSSDAQRFWAQRAKLKNLEFKNTDITEEDYSYDLIVCLDVFEHVEDYFTFLRSIKNKGKSFIFNIPLDMNVMKVMTNGIKFARDEVGHLHYFNEYTALQTLEDCGYNVKDNFLSTAFLSTLPRNGRQIAVLPFRLVTLALGKSLGARLFGGQSLVVFAES